MKKFNKQQSTAIYAECFEKFSMNFPNFLFLSGEIVNNFNELHSHFCNETHYNFYQAELFEMYYQITSLPVGEKSLLKMVFCTSMFF